MKPSSDQAVSPVVGVMLMLVVVIIIAAVVSGFAGGMIGTNNQKAPTLSMDVKIINTGSWAGSGFFATVTAVSRPIPTKDLKIVTSWTAANGGAPVSNGSTVLPNVQNVYYYIKENEPGPITSSADFNKIAPYGTGPGVNGSTTVGFADTNPGNYNRAYQQFGYYTLVPGTSLSAPPLGASCAQVIGGTWVVDGNDMPSGSVYANPSSAIGYGTAGRYSYDTYNDWYGTTLDPFVGTNADPVTAVLGMDWEKLRAGDKVNVKFIHVPTNKIIFDKDIAVAEG
jgi:FlaG/FlaF family flagellin (archaellin)